MTATADEVKAEVLAVAQRVHEAGLVVGTAGNISGKMPDGTVCMTPSSLPYEGMTVEDLVIVDLNETALGILGGHEDALLGKKLTEVMDVGPEYEKTVAQLLAGT